MNFPVSAWPRLLQPGEIHVWHIDLAVEIPQDFARVLDADELRRAERFTFDRHRNRFISGRYAMRGVLGAYLDMSPGEVRIAYGSHGKPRLDDNSAPIYLGFNMTHSEDTALLAVGGARDIGIDLEMLRAPKDIRVLAKSVFSEQENIAFQALAAESLMPAFFTCWTQKEALLKALGTGLTLEANSIHVGLDDADKKVSPPAPYGDEPISLATIARTQHSIASLAVSGGFERVLHFNYADKLRPN